MKNKNFFFYILIFLALAAVAVLIFALAPSGNVPVEPVGLPSPTARPDDSDQPLRDPASVIAVDTDTVQTAIATLERAESYSRTLTVSTFWSGGSASRSVEVWKDHNNVRIRESAEGMPVKNVLLRGNNKWIWYSDSTEVYRGGADDGDEDAYQSLLSYEDVLELDKSLITGAGYTEFDGESCIFVRYVSGELGYESLCYISVATGLLMGEETYDGEKLVYSMVSSAPDISTPDRDIFDTPGSRERSVEE